MPEQPGDHAPAPLPTCPRQAKPGPSRKAIIGWTLAMLAALVLAWFIGVVAVPVWMTRAAVRRAREDDRPRGDDALLRVVLPDCPAAEARVTDLGGQERALERLGFYLRLPAAIAPDKGYAVLLLGHCGDPAVPLLSELLRDREVQVRNCAAAALWRVGPRAEGVLPLLREALRDPHPTVGDTAALAFRNMAQEFPEALFELVDALEDENPRARCLAATTLGGLSLWARTGDTLSVLKRLAGEDGNPAVRKAASEALAEIRAREESR